MNPTPWIVAALLAPLVAAQQSGKPPVSPAAAHAAGGFQPLKALESASPLDARPALEASMVALAEVGDGRALAWCLRHPEAFGDARAQRTAAGFVELVREHAHAAWLRTPEMDPLVALERSGRATRHAVAAALASEAFEGSASRSLALLLRATALAPREARDSALGAQALAHLAELRALAVDGPWAQRADDLSWRLEHLAPGRAAPGLVLRDIDGNEFVLEDWLDGDVLIDVWRADDPERVERAAELAGLLERARAAQPERRLRVLALGLGADQATFRRELEELELPWPTAFEPAAGGPVRSAWRLDGTPTRMWIDSAGLLRAFGGSSDELEAQLLAPGKIPRLECAEPMPDGPSEGTSVPAAPDARREE